MSVRTFRVYFPDDGETADDAKEFRAKVKWATANDIAREACEHDFIHRDGWERGETPFPIIVIDDEGIEHRFTGIHERTVYHAVYSEDPA